MSCGKSAQIPPFTKYKIPLVKWNIKRSKKVSDKPIINAFLPFTSLRAIGIIIIDEKAKIKSKKKVA